MLVDRWTPRWSTAAALLRRSAATTASYAQPTSETLSGGGLDAFSPAITALLRPGWEAHMSYRQMLDRLAIIKRPSPA